MAEPTCGCQSTASGVILRPIIDGIVWRCLTCQRVQTVRWVRGQ